MTRRLVASLLVPTLALGQAVSADVIGRMVPAEPLTAARIATLPASERGPWSDYLARSQQRMADDKAALATERVGLATIPDAPPTGQWASKALAHDAAWYGSAEARRVADSIVSFQTPSGGWGKNQDRTGPRRLRGQAFVISERLPANARSGIQGDDDWAYVGTIDNDATIVELRFLAQVQHAVPGTDGNTYRAAAVKGLRYLLEAQYPNGGWPQVYPLGGGYHDAVTFNDNAMANVVELLIAIAAREGEFAFVPEDEARKARHAVSRALDLFVRTQVVVGGTRTGWGQQHDPLTLRPVGARNYEPAAMSGPESAALLSFLMRVPSPSPPVVRAVHEGVAWLTGRGLRDIEWGPGSTPAKGRRAMPKPGVGPIWARFYDLETMRPIFGDRDRTVHDTVNAISLERRNGYAWYGTGPASTLRQYEAWAARQTSSGAAAAAQPPQASLRVSEALQPGPQMTPYLRAQVDRAWAQDAVRQARLDAVTSEAALLALQREIRSAMLDAIGGLPEARTPLRARVVGSEQLDGYRVERVVFESIPGVHVTAVVYAPDAQPGRQGDEPTRRRPAVLLASGHATIGKAHESYQRIAARLATLGYVVISWDPIGQGERSQFWDVATGDTRYDRVCGEHAVMGNLATLVGASVSRWMVWDGIRALDYLLTRDDVDAERIAITGTSGGGYQSAWIGALDPRIAVIAPSAFITALPMRMANRIFEDPDSDPEQDPPGLVSAGVDHVGLLIAAYPRRIHISAVTRDFFPIEGTRLTFRRVRDVYARFGHGDRVVMSEAFARHSYAEANQLSAFRFLARAFSLPVPAALPDARTLPAERLQVTPTGQVRVDLAGRSFTDLVKDYDDAHRTERTVDIATLYARGLDAAEAAGPIRVEPDAGTGGPNLVTWRLAGSTMWQGLTIDRYLLRHDGIQEIPALHIHRRTPARRTVVHVDLRGKVTAARWGEVSAHLDAGADVISFDLPGAGETRMPYDVATHAYIEAMDETVRHDHPLASVMGNHVYNGLLTGRPYLVDALRAVDVVRAFAASRLGASSLAVTGPGASATLAAAAAAVLPALSLEIAPDAAPFDWRQAVTTSREMWPIQYLVNGGAYIRLPHGSARPADR